MKKNQRAVRLCGILIVVNLAFIWGNSLLPAELSSAFSRAVGSFIRLFLPGSVDVVQGTGQGLLRKLAHGTEFFTLGLLLSRLFHLLCTKKWEHWVFPLLCGVGAACMDETIQIFVPGRGPGLRDVAIDSAGALLGVTLMALLLRREKAIGNG